MLNYSNDTPLSSFIHGTSYDEGYKKIDTAILYGLHASEYSNVVVTMPPRTGATTIITKNIIPYILGKTTFESTRIAYVTYSKVLAEAYIPKESGIYILGINSPITGIGLDYILIDSPVKSLESSRQEVIDYIRYILMTRRNGNTKTILFTSNWPNMKGIYDLFDRKYHLNTFVWDYHMYFDKKCKITNLTHKERIKQCLSTELYEALYLGKIT